MKRRRAVCGRSNSPLRRDRRSGVWRALRFVLLSAAGAAGLVWIARGIEWSDLWTPARRLGAAGLAVGFAAYLLFVALKALRFAAFLKLPFSRALYGVVCAQTFWSNILPMRLGDLSYIPLLKDRMGEPVDRGAASFLLAGLADAWMRLALSASLGAYFLARVESPALRIFTWFSVAGCAAAAAAVPLARLNWRVDRLPFLGKQLAQLQKELQRQTPAPLLAKGALYSALCLAARFGFQLYLLWAMFPDLSAAQGLFAMTFTGLANLLPIQGFAGIGAAELPWAWALSLVGSDGNTAVSSALTLHATALLYAAGAGVLSLWTGRAATLKDGAA